MTSLGIAAIAPQPNRQIHAGMVTASSATFSTHEQYDPSIPVHVTSHQPTGDADDTVQVVDQILQIESGPLILLDQVKRNLVSTKDIVTFLKKRAAIEEEYGKSIQRLCSWMIESVEKQEGKSGGYETSIREMVSIHESVATHHLTLSQNIIQVSDELTTVYKDTDRSRRQLKDASERNDKQLLCSELNLEKAVAKYESTTESWDKIRNATTSPTTTTAKPTLITSMLGKKNHERDEENARARATRANTSYQVQLQATLKNRTEYITLQLPNLIRSLKEVNDECNVALQYHLSKYAFHYEHSVTQDAFALCPNVMSTTHSTVSKSQGIRTLFENMDHAHDLQLAIANARTTARRGSSVGSAGTNFGVSLMELAKRDNADVPLLLQSLTQFIERFGADCVGIYSKSGTHAAIHRVQLVCDKDPTSWALDQKDPHVITGILKLYLRSLPDSVIPKLVVHELSGLFGGGNRGMDSRTLLVKLHQLINQLPDPHYATLRHLVLHMTKILSKSVANLMTLDKLAVLFGPILMHSGAMEDVSGAAASSDMQFQCQVMELILMHSQVLFEADD